MFERRTEEFQQQILFAGLGSRIENWQNCFFNEFACSSIGYDEQQSNNKLLQSMTIYVGEKRVHFHLSYFDK